MKFQRKTKQSYVPNICHEKSSKWNANCCSCTRNCCISACHQLNSLKLPALAPVTTSCVRAHCSRAAAYAVRNARRSVNQSSCWPALDTTSPSCAPPVGAPCQTQESRGLWVGTQGTWVGLGRSQEGLLTVSKCSWHQHFLKFRNF